MHGQMRIAGRDSDLAAINFNEGAPWTFATSIEIVRRRWKTLVAAVGLAIVLAALYVVSTPPLFTATTALIPDTKRTPQSLTEASQNVITDQGLVESQVESLKSERIAIAVIDKLDLWHDSEFVDSDASYLARGIGALKGVIEAALRFGQPTRPAAEGDERRRVILRFKKDLAVTRVGRSYLIEISFTSPDPNKAARVANEVAEAYIQDQLGANFFNAERARTWMQQRAEELRNQANEAAEALENFKLRTAAVARNANAGQLALGGGAAEELRRLETAAQTKKTLYENLLNRYNRAVQFVEQHSFPVTEARVVTEAMPPLAKSYPKTSLILAVALFTGGMLGVAGALAREYFDRSLRSPEQIEQELGVKCLGFLPALPRRSIGGHRPITKTVASDRPPLCGRSLPLFGESDTSHRTGETLRTVKIAIDRGQEVKIVAITSPHAGDGKTTVAINLARVFAQSARRTLLIDGDLRSRSLTRILAPDLADGLPVLLERDVVVADQILRNGLGFHLIGSGSGRVQAHPSDLLSSWKMRELLRRLREVYDCVVIDLPSVLEFVDVAACAELMDAFVLVAHGDRTNLDHIESVLRSSDAMTERLVGVVVNQSRGVGGKSFFARSGGLTKGSRI